MIKHPWHQVSIGELAPEIVRGIIEIPKGSRAKYELDKDSGLLKLDRVLFSSVYYPANYGFIPQTYGEDHDPLDILILSQVDVVPLCIVEAKVIGVMRMLDSGEADDKIIAVAAKDMSVNYINDICDLPPHFVHELKSFFEDYKKLERKEVKVENFLNKEIAQHIINKSITLYENTFRNGVKI
jgi:inorganic pyrophosphatase